MNIYQEFIVREEDAYVVISREKSGYRNICIVLTAEERCLLK